jgi:hypothetical protein
VRLPSAGVLLALGLAFVGTAAALILLRGGAHTQTPPPTTAHAPAAAPPGASAAANGIAISGARVVASTPFSATVEWTTQPATRGRLVAALGSLPPTLWSAPDGPGSNHRATIDGLAFGASYRLVVSASAAGRSAELTLPLSTPLPDGARTSASVAAGALRLDGQPFFPLLVWGQCPPQYPTLLAAGIDVLAENPCGGVADELAAAAGRALVAGVAGQADAENPGVIGWFFPDEADARGLTAQTLPALPPSRATGRVSFLTLSNHVYSLTAPLAGGRAMYPALAARADVVGFDLYPLQELCWGDRIGSVYDAQRELVRLAPGKPTFQWIETSRIRCPGTGATAVTPATVRAETWLAIAGGAAGLGYFPGDWTGTIGSEITRLTAAVKAVAPALLAPPLAVDAGGSPLRVAAHELNGALYVVAANPTRKRASATLRIGRLGDRVLVPLDGGAAVAARSGVARVTLPALGGGVYIVPPAA